MHKPYIVRLSKPERQPHEVIKKLKGSSQKVRRAHILLKADADGPSWTDGRIADAYHCRVHTIENVRKLWSPRGLQWRWSESNARPLRHRHAWMVQGKRS